MELQKDMDYFKSTMESLTSLSPAAEVFCLIHKMDLIPEDQRDRVFAERTELIKSRSYGLEVVTFLNVKWSPWPFRLQPSKL